MIVPSAVDVDPSATEERHEVFEDVPTRLPLDDYKCRLNLPSEGHLSVSEDGTAEAAFTIDETHRPTYDAESFLLVFRTLCIVTAVHATHPIDRV